MATLLLLILGAFEAKAELKVKDYRKAMGSGNSMIVGTTKMYVLGLGEGMEWANATVGSMKIYCQPGKLVMRMENYMQILDRKIESMSSSGNRAEIDGDDIGMVLLLGLQETFPCAGK